MRVLIQGASIAGPVLAYWLHQHGDEVTVVERAPALRKTGGHAIDLFRPAMEISERMGVLPEIAAHATGTKILTAHRPWKGPSSRPARIDYLKVERTMSDRHVEIMRDDLSEIYYDARSPMTVVSRSGEVPQGNSMSLSAPTDCTPGFADWCSAITSPNGFSMATCRWCRCRNRWPATAR
jgi:2-polyprenyl-6-methoxyphenol hydroxylase-like FAD-dependent oxidoreductase